MFLKIFNLVCNPLKNIDYLQKYLNTIQIISLQQNIKARQVYHLLMTLIAYKCVHFFFLGFFSKNFTDYQRIIHYDALYLLVPKFRFSFLGGLVATCGLYYSYVLFKKPNEKMNNLLRSILVENCTSEKRYFLFQTYKGQNVLKYIKHFSIKMLNLFASLILTVGKYY